jgi:multidrug transporter EmrE-like cation transporter
MKNIPLIFMGISLNAAAQILMKKGMIKIGPVSFGLSLAAALPKMFCNVFLWSSVICYGLSCLIWMMVLSRAEIGFAYAFTSLGFVIVTIMGHLIFNEHITPLRIGGIILICIGVILVSKGAVK